MTKDERPTTKVDDRALPSFVVGRSSLVAFTRGLRAYAGTAPLRPAGQRDQPAAPARPARRGRARRPARESPRAPDQAAKDYGARRCRRQGSARAHTYAAD